MDTVTIPKAMLEEIVEELKELRGLRWWGRDEPRCNYQRD